MHHRGVDSYNFLVSQRLTVILAGTLLQARADQTIWTEFRLTSFPITEIKVKVRKRTDCTGRIRGAIAPADDITLRVQPLYESCEMERGHRKALKLRQRAILVDSEASAPHQRQYFRNFGHFEISGPCTTEAWTRMNFLFRIVRT